MDFYLTTKMETNVDLLYRVQKVIHNNVMSLRSMNIVFTRIDFAIQEGLTAQLLPAYLLFKCK